MVCQTYRNKILSFCALCLLVAGTQSLFAQETVYTLGGKQGWSSIETMEGVTYGTGKYGWESIVLDTNSRRANDSTDMLVSFDGDSFSDATGNYSVVSNALLPSDKSVMGSGAGLSLGNGGISLSGKEGALFSTSGVTGSFMIEFWLCPSIAESGEVVFSWRSSRTLANYPLYQSVRASFFNNRLRWEFTNIFSGYSANDGTIVLKEYQPAVPGEWSHHSISYNEETGLLEYRINGRTEDLVYVTTNAKEHGGSLYPPVLGVAANVEFCPLFTGRIDDVRIQRGTHDDTVQPLRYDPYVTDGGYFVTEPIMISNGAVLDRVDALLSEPSQTAVVLYARASDNLFNWDDVEWIPVQNHTMLRDIRGLYFQLAVYLYPDGGGVTSPAVTQIDLTFTEVPVPLAPFAITATPGDGCVTLTWSASVDGYTGGYYVFYGDRPGEYLSREAVQGSSPIDVGATHSITLTGLKNGKIYYFAIASYSSNDSRIMGTLSKEVYARPLKR